ncbi:D-alanyl-D-alanine carboxypeptidase/D-alanyl-D-alanine endopeptidase [Leekyejoonella antrihumi]|uniref:D-alanyl-D-alanine carboxypeptidase/D-alanyl-D-alanine-endopeptidase n=1 Tax=Leekyejoonella antrihumi TaxID=1660198 RepID=A0A563DTZ9_9MICO|nr:D-alanyl-D-alanine carboxypeptidase/D-alanyl-D-alanine-endopeptidase [Leekyejoonella antrihumi]TWP33669.1 D-alanyl-D-alanine carboxypeptidase/D-alanyl-D-alanine-endopeptidase [Leekyejoonella antrihumi]
MRRWHKVGAGAGVVLIVVLGYGTLDVYDVVPGVLTLQDAPQPPVPEPGHAAAAAKSVKPPAAPPSPSVLPALEGAEPTAARIKAITAGPLASKNLTSTVAVTVRDATTGAHLLDRGANKAVTPASVTKLLSAWAIANTMNLSKPLTTKVVAGATGHVVLVAGGDTALSPGRGNPNKVDGHAGLADLAAQVAEKVKAAGRSTVIVDYDTSYAPGPFAVPGWSPDFLSVGYTTRIAQLGLSIERADPPRPAAANPNVDTQRALVKDLSAQGLTVRTGAKVRAAADAAVLGKVESSPLIDVLGMALQDSDDAMVESLTRQAAFADGVAGDNASVTHWVVRTLTKAGFDMAGVHLGDVCGLAEGTTIPVRVLGDVLTSGTSGHNPAFQEVLSRLPVGGWNGTLDDRFLQVTNSSAAGWVRAKTGSLNLVSSLAGTVVDKDGRLLVFAIIANGAFPDGVWATRAAIDNIVADLAKCGCS